MPHKIEAEAEKLTDNMTVSDSREHCTTQGTPGDYMITFSDKSQMIVSKARYESFWTFVNEVAQPAERPASRGPYKPRFGKKG